MNSSITEGATSNKYWRDGTTGTDDERAASGGSTTSSDLDARLGNRLLPLKPWIVLQPDELKGSIISAVAEMLKLRATIKQSEESLARFEKPLSDFWPHYWAPHERQRGQ